MSDRALARLSVLVALGASAELTACHDWSRYDPLAGDGGSGGGNGVTCSLPLVDAFDDTPPIEAQWDKQLNLGGTGDVSNHKLVITLPINTANASAYLLSKEHYAITGCRGFVQLAQAPSMKTKAIAVFALQYDVANAVVLLETEGKLQLKRRIDGSETTVSIIPYDPVEHAYLGLSELDGMVRWEASRDGTTWSILDKAPSWRPSSAVYLKVGASTYQAETSAPGETHFDSVDLAQ